MATSISVNNILSQVSQLEKAEQFRLIQRIIALLEKDEVAKGNSPSLASLAGLGREIWVSAPDIDAYIEGERS